MKADDKNLPTMQKKGGNCQRKKKKGRRPCLTGKGHFI